MEAEEVATAVWGTWEELLLGGAVLRHGTENWTAVANEFQDRTHCPCNFTPEVCKARYEELRKQYSDRIALFEELRKQRVAELKRSLEQSDDSIGSLQSKLRNLEAEKVDICHVDYGSSQTESPNPFQKSDCVELESSGKETSKEGFSAGSFTQETPTKWSSECRTPVKVSLIDMNSQQEIVSTVDNGSVPETLQGGNFRKVRGKRKRKVCNRDVKEGSVGESEFLGHIENNLTLSCSKENSTVSRSKETSTNEDCHVVGRSGLNSPNACSSREGPDDLMGIFESVVNNENASSFCCRHDSQKRARYKNLIKQHLDFDTIRSRIAKNSVKSTRELFRDLLLLTNNALIFYSKTTREHKSSLLLRDYITKLLRLYDEQVSSRQNTAVVEHYGPAVFFLSPISNAPVKPRSARPHNQKVWKKTANGKKFVAWSTQGRKHSTKLDSLPSSEEGLVRQEHDIPLKQRKRARKR